MLSKQTVKYLKSLQIKKFRKENGQFLVEGEKSVAEILSSSIQVKEVYATESFLKNYSRLLKEVDYTVCTEEQLGDIGSFKTNNAAIALCEIPETAEMDWTASTWTIALDGINDPGNLGTIIRIADWYGIEQILCSDDTVELFNPKVIAASKGSFTRVKVIYGDLEVLLKDCPYTIYVADLEGVNIHQHQFPEAGVLLMGSEADGIRISLKGAKAQKLTIPRFGEAESLNVGVATGICLDRIRG
ncbi:MAG: RNA methyltransferase [Cytophagaceae bacterium]